MYDGAYIFYIVIFISLYPNIIYIYIYTYRGDFNHIAKPYLTVYVCVFIIRG